MPVSKKERKRDILPEPESTVSKVAPGVKAAAEIAEASTNQASMVFDAVKGAAPKLGMDDQSVSPLGDWTNGLYFTSMGFTALLYIFRMIAFGMAENKTLMESGGFLADTVKVGIYFGLMIAVIAAAPAILMVTAVVMTAFAALDTLINIGSIIKNTVQYFTATFSKSKNRETVFKERKRCVNNIKTAAVGLGKSLVALGLSLVGLLVPVAAPWVGLVGSVIGSVFMAVGIYKIGRELKEKYGSKDKSAKQTKGAAPTPPMMKPKLCKESIDFRNNLDFIVKDAQGLSASFKKNDLSIQLKEALVKAKATLPSPDKKKIEVDGQGKVTFKISPEKLQKEKPSTLKKLQEHERFVLTREVDPVSLTTETQIVASRIMTEMLVSNRLHHHSQHETRYQKLCACEDLQFILSQLPKIMKETDKTKPQILFLNFRKGRDLDKSGYGEPVTLPFTDFHANRNKIWEEIKSYLMTNYPKCQNSMFKHTEKLGEGSGEVKSLFDSLEALIKQKTVAELEHKIKQLANKYTEEVVKPGRNYVDAKGLTHTEYAHKVREAVTPEQKNKQAALKHLTEFLGNMNTLFDPAKYSKYDFAANNNQLVLKRDATTNTPTIYYDQARGKLICNYDKVDSGVIKNVGKEYDLSTQDGKNKFVRYFLDDAKKQFPVLNESDRALGKVAEMYDDVFSWVKMQDGSSHLKPVQPAQQRPVQPSQPAVPPTPTPVLQPTVTQPVAQPTMVSTAAPQTVAQPTAVPTAAPQTVAQPTTVPTAAPQTVAQPTTVPTAAPQTVAQPTTVPTAAPQPVASSTTTQPTAQPVLQSDSSAAVVQTPSAPSTPTAQVPQQTAATVSSGQSTAITPTDQQAPISSDVSSLQSDDSITPTVATPTPAAGNLTQAVSDQPVAQTTNAPSAAVSQLVQDAGTEKTEEKKKEKEKTVVARESAVTANSVFPPPEAHEERRPSRRSSAPPALTGVVKKTR